MSVGRQQKCAACGGAVEIVEQARGLQFCRRCETLWQESHEYAQMVTARERFAERRRAEEAAK